MGSLRNIMNIDEDHMDMHSMRRDRRPASRSVIDHDASMAMPRYSMPVDLSTAQFSQNHRRTSPTHGLHSMGHSSPTGSRRRSNTSTDSMESSYSHAQPTASYPGVSVRPIMPGSSDSSVKLTPITGRVSRAKKGVPVHTCEVCRPPKTFTRAEHLRRHQLSHQPPELACTVPGCEKVFHRKDLLERHQQRHEQDEKLSKDGAQSSRRSYATSSPSRGYAPSLQGVTMASGHWSSMTRAAPGGNPLSSPHLQEAQNAYQLGEIKSEYVVDSTPSMQASNARMIPGYDEPRTTPETAIMNTVPELYMSDPLSSSLSWAGNSGIPSSASGSTYSTPPSDHSHCHHPTRTPTTDWPAHISAFPTASRELQSPIIMGGGYSMSFGYATTPPQAYASLYGDGMGIPFPGYEDNGFYGQHILDTTVRSLSPQLLVGQSSETLVTAPSALPTDRLMYPRAISREPVDALGLFIPHGLMPVAVSREARSAIPTYIEVYWDKVHSMYPTIHKPTFDIASDMIPEHLDILQCAMAAIATQFLEHKEHRNNGHQLHAYAWDRLKMYTTSQEWPLPIMQSVLLCEYYARFRGRNKKAYQPSLRFETLFLMVINMQNSFVPSFANCDDSQRWKIWVEMESRRRLLSACFLLDVHATRYLEQTRMPSLSLDYNCPETLPIPLSVSTSQLWDAQNYQEWSNMDTSNVVFRTVGSTLLEGLSAADTAALPVFDVALLQAAYSLQLPHRSNLTEVDLIEDASTVSVNQSNLMNLFPYSASAMAYLALQHTPLQTLLSVSGDSWVFNKKVLDANEFMEHQQELKKWRDSGSAAVATAFAARALNLFFGLQLYMGDDGQTLMPNQLPTPQYREISDFWGVYVCALICWAFGHVGACRPDESRPSKNEGVQWIMHTMDMQPGQIQNMPENDRQNALGVVSLARASLERDCLGGRNMLLADALGVLKKLEEGENFRKF